MTIYTEGDQQAALARVVEAIATTEGVKFTHQDGVYDVLLKVLKKVGVPVIHAERRDHLLAKALEYYAVTKPALP